MTLLAWLRARRLSHSGRSKFVQNGYPKKTKDPVREDWRKRKGFARDQAKNKHFCKCRINDARYRRRWERDLIRKGQWEEIYTDKNMFTSGWDCC